MAPPTTMHPSRELPLLIKMAESDSVIDALLDQHELRLRARRKRRLQFNLSTLMWIILAAAIVCWLLVQWGQSLWQLLCLRVQQTWAYIPIAPVLDVIAISSVVFGILLGGLVFWMVNRLGGVRSYLALGASAFLGLLCWTIGLSLQIESLSTTQAKNVSVAQIAYAALLVVGTVVPIGAFLGWRFAELNAPDG